MADSLLTIKHLKVSIKSRDGLVNEVTRDVSLEIGEHEFVSLVGPSGCGKTTLLRAASGLRTPTSGNLLFEGKPITDVPPGISIVFQEYNKSLFPWLTIGKNVAMGARDYLPEERGRRVEIALKQVGLSGFATRYPWELSGGMQQRAALARAMVSNPRILMMDEPFASVDALTRNHLEDVVQELWINSNFSALMVTHDVGEAVYLSDRVFVLSSRPSTILAEIKIDLPRPRSQLETRKMLRFVELQAEVLERVEEAGRQSVGIADRD
ncbi:MAG: ABC transporter ATP-binding protein [Actinomycetota bacterium]|nr:ABC transporter ATP-binding protein [Actinomycetota bacterium]